MDECVGGQVGMEMDLFWMDGQTHGWIVCLTEGLVGSWEPALVGALVCPVAAHTLSSHGIVPVP